MASATDFLMNIRRIIKMHESMLKEICQEYGLTLIEATVISFLYNNPGKDTAADIAELRMLQKSNVSQAVELLAQKGFLGRRQDQTDRRKVHLSLTEKAAPITVSMERLWISFEEEVFSGIPESDREIFSRVNDRMKENIQNSMKRREQK